MCASFLLMLVTYSSRFEVLHFVLVDSNHTLFASGSVRVLEFLTRRVTTSFLLNSALLTSICTDNNLGDLRIQKLC